MELKTPQTVNIDVLVVGGGAAGLKAAIEAKKHGLDVVLLSESPVGFRNNTAISGGVFAASGIWKGTGDSSEVYFRDTVNGGCLINDRRLVDAMTRGATQQVYDLMQFGVNFEKQNGDLKVQNSPGHTYPRNVVGVKAGISLTKPMREYATSVGVQFEEGILVTKLLKVRDMVTGVLGIDDKGQVLILKAKSTILATGGAGELYLRSDNALGTTGDGYALAYEIGASLRDMDFVQFYPTALGEYARKVCDYGILVSQGAIIRNSLGEDILEKYGIKELKLMTRDILSKAMMIEIAENRGIGDNLALDFTGIPEEEIKIVHQFTHSRYYPEKVLVAPTAHFFMGGVEINENCETKFDGLYAAGEVCGGAHGANRIEGNAITETLVFGTIAGGRAATRASKMKQIPPPGSQVAAEVEKLRELTSHQGRENLNELQQSLKQIMWRKVGIIRNEKGLADAQREILALREQLRAASPADYRQLSQAIKLGNMLTVSEMVCKAALARTESRGAHYRTDYPEQNDAQWLKTIEVYCHNGEMMLRVVPVNSDK